MTGRCIMMAAGEYHPMKIEKRPEDFVIAVDGGLKYLLEYRESGGIWPDFLIGDFDSLEPQYTEIVEEYRSRGEKAFKQLPVEKDDPDTMAAARIALSRGYTEILIYGGLGARMDHAMANIETLTWIARQGAAAAGGQQAAEDAELVMHQEEQTIRRPQGWLLDRETRITVIGPGTFYLPEGFEGTVSVFSLDRELRGVTIRGLKYEMENGIISNDFPIGCSNETLSCTADPQKEQAAFISIKEGTALVILIEKLINTHHGVAVFH